MAKTMLAALALCAAASAHAAVGDYAMFFPSRDWGNLAVYSDYANSGLYPWHRAYRQDWGECYLADWDAEEILNWMLAHPLGASEQYRFTLNLCTAGSWDDCCGEGYVRYEIRTLNMPVDWAEGDADFLPGSYSEWNYSPNTPAATNLYAQAFWYFEGFVPTLDLDNCVPWTTHDGTAVEAFKASPSLFRNINGVYDKNQNGSIDPDELGAKEDFYMVVPTDDPLFIEGSYVTAELQYDPDHPSNVYPVPLVNDLLFNENNRGIVLGPAQAWDPAAEEWVPCEDCCGRFYSKDCDDPAFKPFLLVELPTPPLPFPGDANHDWAVDGGDYAIWADNYGKTDAPAWSDDGWVVGNFTEDTNVDGGDYTVWADWYGYGTGGAGVPAPAALWLLAVAAAAALTRRR